MIKLLFLAAGLSAYAATHTNPVIEKIRAYNHSLLEMERPTGNDVLVYNYTTEFQYHDETMVPEKVTTTLYVGETDLHYLSNRFDVFMDRNFVATVLKEEKQILFTRAVSDYDPSFAMAQMGAMQNLVLDSSKVVYQKTLDNGQVEIVLDTQRLKRAGLYVTRVTYRCDPSTGEIKQSVTEYSEEYEISKMIYTQHKVDFAGTYKGFKPVEKMIFKPNYTLQDKYQGYELIVD